MTLARTLMATGAVVVVLVASPARAGGMSAADFMRAANTNDDRTLSKTEMETYARKRFVELEADGDRTLDQGELKDRLSNAGMAAADRDKDKTVDEAEFVAYADKLFAEANKKGDRTLSLDELASPAGERLIALLH